MKRILLIIAWLVAMLPASAADTVGLRVGQKFTVPVSVNGKSGLARAIVAADKTMSVWFIGSDGVDSIEYTLTRKDVGPDPQPQPDPQPNPDPQPDPKPTPVGKLWAVVIEETRNRTPDQAAVFSSQKVRALFEGGWRMFDPTDTDGSKRPVPADVKPFTTRVDAGKMTLPVLFVVDEKGVVYWEGDVPATEAKVESLVAEIRGAK